MIKKILSFFKKIKKEEYNQESVVIFRENYSLISGIYRGSIYPIKNNTGIIIFVFSDFNKFWNKFIINRSKEDEEGNSDNSKFITIRVINEKKEYVYTNMLREKVILNNKNLKPINNNKEIKHFTNGLIEIGFWDFDKRTFSPFWSSKYSD